MLLDVEKVKTDVILKRKELEKLYNKFEAEIKTRETVISKYEEKKQIIDKQEKKIDQLHMQNVDRILSKEDMVKKYVMRGITTKEVVSLIGEPTTGRMCTNCYYYGRIELLTNDADIVEIYYYFRSIS